MEKREAIVITNPMIAANRSAEVTLSKFLRVIAPCYDVLRVLGGNLCVEENLREIELCSYPIVRAGNKIKRVVDIVIVQFKMAIGILKNVKKDTPVYFWIADKMIIPYVVAKLKGCEISYFVYGNVVKEGKESNFARVSSKLIRFMAEHADYTGVESKSVINEWYGLKYKKIRVVHLYTDSIEMNSIESRRNAFGMVCRLTTGKHVLECIEAMSLVHTAYPDWQLEIIGSGKQQIECEQLIERLGAGEYVKLLGWIEHEEIVQYSEHWKYLLFPTDTEGMPNGMIEMMGRGIPALATPVGGILDVVLDGINGFHIEKNDIESIAEKIQAAIVFVQNIEEYVKMSERAYQTIKKDFSLKAAQNDAMIELM